MNTGVVQIMWKEIGLGFLILYVIRNILDIYMVKKYKKIVKMYGAIEMNQLKWKAEKHLKLCDFFSVGPWNKQIYLSYNGLCWLLASISFSEDNEREFLEYLGKVKKENEFELKSFVLFLYYRSKNEDNQAKYYYNLYLNCKHVDKDIAIIMDGIWNEQTKNDVFRESVKSFNNPTLKKLLKDNRIL